MRTKYSHLTNAELVQCYRHEEPSLELIEEMWVRIENGSPDLVAKIADLEATVHHLECELNCCEERD